MSIAVVPLVLGTVLFLAMLATLSTPDSVKLPDDTDPIGARSELTLYTDAATGIQYVGTVRGGLTVRVDKEGKPMLVKQIESKENRNE